MFLLFKKKKRQKREIICSPILRIVLIVCTFLPAVGLFSNLKGYFETLDKEYFDYFCVPAILLLSFWILIYVTTKWKISYDDNSLIYRNCFGISKEYPFSELRIKTKDICIEIYCNEKKITDYVTLMSITPEATEFEKKVMKNKT